MFKVVFSSFSKLLQKEFIFEEFHKSEQDARLKSLALNWQIVSMERI